MIKISRYHFSIVLFFHYQHSGIGRYTFFSARKAEFLRGSGLDGDVVLVYAITVASVRCISGICAFSLGRSAQTVASMLLTE